MSFDPTSVYSYTVIMGSGVDTIQTGPAAVYNMEISNSDSIGYWVKLYDGVNGNPTIGSSTITLKTIYVPSKTTQPFNFQGHPVNFANGAYAWATQNIAASDTVAPNANVLTLNAGYR